jgi:hypothetical protein
MAKPLLNDRDAPATSIGDAWVSRVVELEASGPAACMSSALLNVSLALGAQADAPVQLGIQTSAPRFSVTSF